MSPIDLIAISSSTKKQIKNGTARQRPKNWMKMPVLYCFSTPVDYGRIAALIQPFCTENKLVMETDSLKTGSRIQKMVMGFSRWDCAIVVNNIINATELTFQVLSWFDNAGNNIPIFKLISHIEKSILSVYPDVIVVEDGQQKRLADLYLI